MVLSNSPAFLADIVAGDVLVAVNNTKVNDINHAHSLITGLERDGQDITLTVIKDGKQINIGFGVVEGDVTAGEVVEPTLSPDSLSPESSSPESGNGTDNDWINPDTIQNENEKPPVTNTPSVVF